LLNVFAIQLARSFAPLEKDMPFQKKCRAKSICVAKAHIPSGWWILPAVAGGAVIWLLIVLAMIDAI